MNQDTHPPDSSSSLATTGNSQWKSPLGASWLSHESRESGNLVPIFSKLPLVAVQRLWSKTCPGLSPQAPASQVPRCSWRGQRSIPQNHVFASSLLEISNSTLKHKRINWIQLNKCWIILILQLLHLSTGWSSASTQRRLETRTGQGLREVHTIVEGLDLKPRLVSGTQGTLGLLHLQKNWGWEVPTEDFLRKKGGDSDLMKRIEISSSNDLDIIQPVPW